MPYVDQEARDRLAESNLPRTSGELNYLITELVISYLKRETAIEGRLRYAALNDAMGALMGAQSELYRRVGSPLEDMAIVNNGDVYPVELTGPQDECGRSALAASRERAEHTACGTDECCMQCDTATGQSVDYEPVVTQYEPTVPADAKVYDRTTGLYITPPQITHYEPVNQGPDLMDTLVIHGDGVPANACWAPMQECTLYCIDTCKFKARR